MNGVDLPAWTMLLPVAGYGLAMLVAAFAASGRVPRPIASAVIVASALVGALIAVNALLNGDAESLKGWTVFAGIRLGFHLDAVAAFFSLVISVPAAAASLYGVAYLDAHHDGHHPHPHPHPEPPKRAGTDAALAGFLAAMSLLVLADGIFGFLFAWELMSVVSFFLVLGDGHGGARRAAAVTYVTMTHIATGFVVVALLALAQAAGSFQFAAIAAHAQALPGWQRDAVFLLALLGFGTKAGLVPLHVWLPKAHPAAPSHVSALMSGVMVKMAIYGLVRVLFELAGPGPRWWGVVLLAAGAISALLGILYALMERDLKRVLAFSTVEHLGIVTLGLGAASLLVSEGHPTLAGAALFALFLHLLNHALFKSLLFLGAGAVQTAAGTRDLERLGGLIRGMPRTAACVLTGCAAIAALPPLNGFAGEWLLFQSLLSVGSTGSTAIGGFGAIVAAVLALTGALAVACFVRAFGIAFLGQARSEAAGSAKEVPASMQAGMAALAALCLLAGIGAQFVLRLLAPAVRQLAGEGATPPVLFARHIVAGQTGGTYAPLAVVLLLGAVGVIPWLIARLAGGPSRVRVAPPWVCGFRLETRMQYTATAFAKPLRLIFQFLVRPEREIALDRPDTPFVVRGVRYRETLRPIYDRYLYGVIASEFFALARRVRPLQSGSIRIYLGYVLVTLVVVILLAR